MAASSSLSGETIVKYSPISLFHRTRDLLVFQGQACNSKEYCKFVTGLGTTKLRGGIAYDRFNIRLVCKPTGDHAQVEKVLLITTETNLNTSSWNATRSKRSSNLGLCRSFTSAGGSRTGALNLSYLGHNYCEMPTCFCSFSVHESGV